MPGAPLAPLKGWTKAFHGRFVSHNGDHEWIVDADFLDFDQKLRLYRDGEEFAVRKSPAKFEIGGDTRIEAAMGMFGMERIELIRGEQVTTMTPVEGTPEAWRLALARDRPSLSRAIGVISWIVLVIASVIGISELLGFVGIGSTIDVPGSLATVIGLAALAAVIERALRFKSNRWLG